MQPIIITNRDLQPVHAFLTQLPLTGAVSRARSKIINMLQDAIIGLADSEMALLREHANLDTDGQPIVAGEVIEFKNTAAQQQFVKDRMELLAEKTLLTGQSFIGMPELLLEALTAYQEPLTGEDAHAYDRICEALEHAAGREDTSE